MRRKTLSALVVGLCGVSVLSGAMALTQQEQLGKELFFDENLSVRTNQSCAACHAPNVGWTGPDTLINAHGAVYEGSIPGAFGNRKPPSAAYAGDSPVLYLHDGLWTGGMFWDGRATGWTLGDPLAEQALGPFLNPKEQAVADVATLITKVQVSAYKELFASECPGSDMVELYNCIGRAIAAYERSAEVSAFTSKYDYFLKGEARLTGQEMQGLLLFRGKGQCIACHAEPLFTDFTYDNLGIPKNPENPATMENPNWADPGLGGFLNIIGQAEEIWLAEMGKQKVPTLRNVALKPTNKFVKAYGHNGYFKSLEGIVRFYNTRDVWPTCPGNYPEAEALKAKCWPLPEVDANVNDTELGNLGLKQGEEAAIVAFLKTLSDGYKP